jgi:hypothetical protein
VGFVEDIFRDVRAMAGTYFSVCLIVDGGIISSLEAM